MPEGARDLSFLPPEELDQILKKDTNPSKPEKLSNPNNLRIVSRDGQTVPPPTIMEDDAFAEFQRRQAEEIAKNFPEKPEEPQPSPEDAAMLEAARVRAEQSMAIEKALQEKEQQKRLRREQQDKERKIADVQAQIALLRDVEIRNKKEATQNATREYIQKQAALSESIGVQPMTPEMQAALKEKRQTEKRAEMSRQNVDAELQRTKLETFALMNDAVKGIENLTREQQSEINALIASTKESLRLDTPQGLAQARDFAQRANNLKMRADRLNTQVKQIDRVAKITLTNPKAPTGFFSKVKSFFGFGGK